MFRGKSPAAGGGRPRQRQARAPCVFHRGDVCSPLGVKVRQRDQRLDCGVRPHVRQIATHGGDAGADDFPGRPDQVPEVEGALQHTREDANHLLSHACDARRSRRGGAVQPGGAVLQRVRSIAEEAAEVRQRWPHRCQDGNELGRRSQGIAGSGHLRHASGRGAACDLLPRGSACRSAFPIYGSFQWLAGACHESLRRAGLRAVP
mmetsp:Transcript_105760/g.273763  ORF Transcript_105760/g.273763 Transcript_105760/m.273763 type:complete len:205 (-) Transcript_105760:79-693(-)